MKTTPTLERAESYLSLNLSPATGSKDAPPALPFITLSREAGAGASSLATLTAQRLNQDLPAEQPAWRVFDGNLVEATLEKLRYPDRFARFMPEDAISEIDAFIGELLGRHPNLWHLEQKTNEIIRQIAQRGHCILIGRAANFVTADLPNGLHLRLIGDLRDRMNHMAQLHHTTRSEAHRRNALKDAARRRYVRTQHNRDVDDSLGYDLIINTSSIGLKDSVGMLVAMIHARTPVPPA